MSFLQSIILQIVDEESILFARHSKESTPTVGTFRLSEKAFNVAIPILMPVNEPGPISHTDNVISHI